MAIVCIAGVAPGVGKTAVAGLLLAQLKGWPVARVRVADEIGPAEAALLAGVDYRVIRPSELPGEDPEVSRLLAAGAAATSILLAEPRGLDAGLKAMLAHMASAGNLLVEGNAFLWARQADVSVMVLGPGPSGKGLARVRPSVREIFPKIDIWAWNTRTDPHAEGFFEFPQTLARMGFRTSISNRADFHLVNPREADQQGNASFVDCVRDRLRQRQGPPPSRSANYG
jgi:hypothetical protein